MPNALIPDLNMQMTESERDYVLRYLQQLHFIHGYSTIFLTHEIVDKGEVSLDYVKVFPERFKEEVCTFSEAMKNEIDEILWNTKKTDYMEANLAPFVSLYSLWLGAALTKAFVLFSRLSLISPVIHLCQVLADQRRDFLGGLAEDIELWFFSHFADVQVQWPFFLCFSEQNIRILEKQIDIKDFHPLLNQMCIYPHSNAEWNQRTKIIAKARNYAKLILVSSKKLFRSETVATKTPIAPSNNTLRSFEQLTWNFSTFAEQANKIIRKGNRFTPCFAVDALYPRELIAKMRPLEGSIRNMPMLLGIAPESSGYKVIELAQKAFQRRLSRSMAQGNLSNLSK